MAKKAQLDEVRPVLNDVNEQLNKIEGALDSIEAGADKATDILETGLEKVADVVPEALDKSVQVAAEGTRKGVRFFQSPKVLVTTVVIAGVAVGAGAAYYFTKKRVESKLRKEFETELDKQIDGMRLFYEKRSTKKQPYSSPEEAAAALVKNDEDALAREAAEALNEYEGDQPPPGIVEEDPRQGSNQRTRYDKIKTKKGPRVPVSETHADDSAVPNPEEVTHNVFVQAGSIEGWDQEREESSRTPEHPYVISHDEYMEGAVDDQRTLTYYAGDDILADEREVHLDDVEGLVGVRNLQLFGHGSRDSNVVYIRNERLEVEFEIYRNPGKYVEEVVGLEHSDSPRIRHGRRGDDG